MDATEFNQHTNKSQETETTEKNNLIIAERIYNQKLLHRIIRESDGNLQLQGSVIRNLKMFLDLGTDINAKNNEGLTPLHLAVDYRMIDVINFLISRNAQLYVRDNNGNSIIHFLIEKEFQKLKKYDTFGKFSALSVLVDSPQKQSTDFIEWLVEKQSVRVNSTNMKGDTPLNLAAKYNLLHAIPILLKYTKDTKHINFFGQTALQVFVMTVCGKSSEKCESKINQENFNEKNSMPIANYEPSYVEEMCEEFLKKRFSVDVMDENKNTLLHFTLHERKRNLTKLMMKYSNNINARDNERNTALDIIINYGVHDRLDKELIQILLSEGADIHISDNKRGFSPLINAVRKRKLTVLKVFKEYGVEFCPWWKTENLLLYFFGSNTPTDIQTYDAIVDLLLDEGCDVNVKDDMGMTPLHFACQRGKIKAAENLIKYGANLNSIELIHGHSLLHDAIVHKYDKLVKLLIQKGADVNAITEEGRTSLHLVSDEFIGIIEYLVKKGCYTDVKDNYGLLPFQVAMLSERYKVMEELFRLMIIRKFLKLKAMDFFQNVRENI